MNNFYLTGIEKKQGKSFVAIGIAAVLQERYSSLQYFKLFKERDHAQLEILEKLLNKPLNPVLDIFAAIDLMQNNPDELCSKIIAKSKKLNYETLNFFEGSDFESDNDVVEYQFNLFVARQLNSSVIITINAHNRTIEHTIAVAKNALNIAKNNHATIGGIIVNQVPLGSENKFKDKFKSIFPKLAIICIIPRFEDLANPTVYEIVRKLDAKVLFGSSHLSRAVQTFTVAAKTMTNFLATRLERSGMLIITPDDRMDILLGSLLAEQSANYPKIAGILLTGGGELSNVVTQIIDGLEHTFPVLVTKLKTYESAIALFQAKFSLNINYPEKITKATNLMQPYLLKSFGDIASLPTQEIFSPAVFLYDLMLKVKNAPAHIVLPEGCDNRILKAADYLLSRKILPLTLLGNKEKILRKASLLNLKLEGVKINELTADIERYAKIYADLRKHKNVNLPIAIERMNDVNFFGAMMVYTQDADAMVSGAMHTTADTVRPALEIIKTSANVKKVSSVFIMCLPNKIMIYGDCAINPEPDSATLAEIAEQAAQIAKSLDITPKVALLSYSSGKSGSGSSVDKIRDAVKIIKASNPDYIVEGPIQYDAAVDKIIAAKKLKDSKLKGQANVLIFPDLNTGNNTYKAVQRETGALAIGPILLGLNKPVNDLSRGCTIQDIINTILITASQVKKS